MNTAEKIFQEVILLPDFQALEVLDFVGYLKSKQSVKTTLLSQDKTEFDQFGAVYNGKFIRN